MPSFFGDLFDDPPATQPAPAQPQQEEAPMHPGRRRHQEQESLFKMPFGKFKGTPVLELEAGYLCFLWWRFAGELRDPLRANVLQGLKSFNIDPDGDEPQFGNTR